MSNIRAASCSHRPIGDAFSERYALRAAKRLQVCPILPLLATVAEPERYVETYWSRFPDVWVHGDWAAIDDDGLWYILGRSDDTIKIAGKRVGPAEVESVLFAHPQVSEAAAVGIPDSIKGEALVCFCVLKKDANWSGSGRIALAAELKEKVACDLGKTLAPRQVIFVGDIPKTRNAKVMRRIVRAAYLGEKLGDTSALENAASLDEIQRAAK